MSSPAAAPPSLSPARPRGVTAVEMLIVLTVIAILATIAYPKLNFTKFQADAGARMVRITLQNAQRLAVTRQYNVIVGFDTALKRIRVTEDNNSNETADGSDRVTWHPLEEGVQFRIPPAAVDALPLSGPVVGSKVKVLDGLPSIIFRRDGAASTDLDVYITSKRALPEDFRVVRVVQSTGRTEWLRYLSTGWKQASL
ncbi:MAG: type II secretion system protein [Gemmatimonadaceae bacterium]|nr:type II secretion system protein [Gemmatimonadaceae bacterium]